MDWKELLLGSENWNFLLETLLRTFIMYVVILTFLRIVGKRGVTQLSVFELVLIIGLGSAAGDPMFYKDVGLLVALVVFTVVVGSYLLTTYLVGKFRKFEEIVEGVPIYLIENGEFSIHNFEKEALAHDEFFAELRHNNVTHLGQLKLVIIEASGNISPYFQRDEDVKYGLPILPHLFNQCSKKILEQDLYSCIFCGYTGELASKDEHRCPKCDHNLWVKAINEKRIT